jgi:hypothetical protein
MTKYDFWLKDHKSAFNTPRGYEPVYEFARSTHKQFREELCELIACYPDKSKDNFDQRALDVIWDLVCAVFRESKVLRKEGIPAVLRDGAKPALLKFDHVRYFEGGYTQRIAYVAGKGVKSGSYWVWYQDRFHVNRDYRVDDANCVCAMTLQTVFQCAAKLNPGLTAAIEKLVSGGDEVTVADDEPNTRSNARALYARLKPMSKESACEEIARQLNRSPVTIRKLLQGA